MPTIFSSFEVVFTKVEIESLLIERAKQIVGGSEGLALHGVEGVGPAVRVKLNLEEKDAG